MVHVLDHAPLTRAGHADEIDHGQMLHILAKAHAPGMRTHGQTVLCGQQEYQQHLVDPSQPAGVDLHHVDGATQDELLEENAVLAHLSRGDLDRGNGFAHRAVALHIVRAGRLLDEPGPGKGQLPHPADGLPHLPGLVGVDHQLAIRPQHLARNGHAPDVVLQAAPHLELDVVEAAGHRLAAQAAQLVVVIAQPAGRGRVAGIALALQHADALGLARRLAMQQLQRLGFGQGIRHVAEVQRADELLGREIGHQAPQRLALGLGPQVPHGIDHGAGGQVHRPLVRADPAQLAVGGDVAPKASHVLADPVKLHALHQVPHGRDGGAADLVAAPDSEGQPVPLQAGRVRLQDHIGGGVVRVRVHGVRPIQVTGGRKAHIEHAQGQDSRHGLLRPCRLSRDSVAREPPPWSGAARPGRRCPAAWPARHAGTWAASGPCPRPAACRWRSHRPVAGS